MPLAQEPGLHVEVERPLRAARLNARDPLHLCRRIKILEIVCFVDEQVVDAQLVEHQAVVLLLLGEQVLEPLVATGFLLLN